MTFDDENKPKSQDIPNTQVPQASGDEVGPQSGAVGANAGGLEEMDAEEVSDGCHGLIFGEPDFAR